jgi:hypothetical protein
VTHPIPDGDAFAHALAAERRFNAERLAWLRLIGVAGFFAQTMLAGWIVDPAWWSNVRMFAAYLVIAIGLLVLSRLRGAPFRIAGLEVALVDMPMTFLLQFGMLTGGVADRGIAGFSVGLFLSLVMIAGLGLDGRAIAASAVVGIVLEVVLQTAAGVTMGGRGATVILMALGAATCAHLGRRVIHLVASVSNASAATSRRKSRSGSRRPARSVQGRPVR